MSTNLPDMFSIIPTVKYYTLQAIEINWNLFCNLQCISEF